MSKPDRILLSYVQVRGPALSAVYQIIKEKRSCSISHLKELFCIPKKGGSGYQIGQLHDCLNFLRTVDLVETTVGLKEEIYRIEKDLPEMPFHLILLHKLRIAERLNVACFYEVQRVLARNDMIFIDSDHLRRLVEKSLDLGFAWTKEKLNFWLQLADYLELGKITSSGFIFYPSPKLVHSLLTDFSRNHKQERLSRFVQHLRLDFFECLTEPERLQLCRGFQQSLLLLEENGRVIFTSMSDDPESIRIGDRSVSLTSVTGG